MAFVLFLLVNATLFIRPPEVFPELGDLQFYLYFMVPCMVLAFPAVLRQLRWAWLETHPVNVCVLGLLAAVVLSNAANMRFEKMLEGGIEFLKVVIYYLLLVTLVNTPARLRLFLSSLALFALSVTLLAVLHFHGVITMPALEALKEYAGVDPVTQQPLEIHRLHGTGLFGDPNDFCLMLVLAVPICLFNASRARGLLRVAWLGPLLIFGYALTLTQSRGGFLALLACVLALLYGQFGKRGALTLAVPVMAVLFLLFAGRSTSLEVAGGTSQQRIQIWSDGILCLREGPLFGIGMEQYQERVGYVAHNSFLHGFAELGFFGGTLFLGGFAVALWSLARIAPYRQRVLDPELRNMLPCVLGIVAGSVVGMLSLSRCYIVSTYTVLGVAVAYLDLARVYPPLPPLRCDVRLAGRLATASVAFLVVTYSFVRLFLRW